MVLTYDGVITGDKSREGSTVCRIVAKMEAKNMEVCETGFIRLSFSFLNLSKFCFTFFSDSVFQLIFTRFYVSLALSCNT